MKMCYCAEMVGNKIFLNVSEKSEKLLAIPFRKNRKESRVKNENFDLRKQKHRGKVDMTKNCDRFKKKKKFYIHFSCR